MKRLSLILVGILAVAGCNSSKDSTSAPPVVETAGQMSLSEWNSFLPTQGELEVVIPAEAALFNKKLNGTDLVDVTLAERNAAVAKLNSDGENFRQAILAKCALNATRTQTGLAERPGQTQVTTAVLDSAGPECTYPARFSNSVSSTISKISIDPISKRPTYLDTKIARIQKVSQLIEDSSIRTASGMKSYSLTLQDSGQQVIYRQNGSMVTGINLKGTGVLSFVSEAGETIVINIQTQFSQTTRGKWSVFTATSTTSKGSMTFEARTTWDGNQKTVAMKFNDVAVADSVALLSDLVLSL